MFCHTKPTILMKHEPGCFVALSFFLGSFMEISTLKFVHILEKFVWMQ